MTITARKFSEAEELALRWAHEGVLISRLTERVQKDVFGGIDNPGEAVIRKLVKEDLIFITEEEPILIHGTTFEFTPSLGLTDQGEIVFASLKIRS